ncbi:uncharacterized protein LOC126881168 [Diabrotica virgifera virgifera]|uniref:CCHC-type domain-containing protein n=1 Tax=Diabrotica virgifera virgifera TaxID=50390 RepID=A0ABM5JTE5_DIAVI|nr:uncharacterized protein LOC126881168 [Diabrotica virgifera virgifera]
MSSDVTIQDVPANKSYSTAASQQNFFPGKENAILFSAINNTPLQDYLISLGNLINPKNILFSSRLSNNRICMYLSCMQAVEDFMTNYGSIQVNGETVRARRLITPAERIVLSNVCPSIPHEVIIQELKHLGLNLVSPITFLKISASLPEYSHIKSFRRQVFISPHNTTIPDSILLNYDNTNYRIFISQDSMTCYICKQINHIASNCPSNKNSSSQPSGPLTPPTVQSSDSPTNAGNQVDQTSNNDQNKNTEIFPQVSIPNTSNSTSVEIIQPVSEATQDLKTNENTPLESSATAENIEIISQTSLAITKESPCPSTKRTIEETLSPPVENVVDNQTFLLPAQPHKTKTQKNKKPKRSLPIPESLESYLSKQSTPSILSYDQLMMLIENIQGSQSPIEIVKEFTSDFLGLVNLLTVSYQYIPDRATKYRFTRLKTLLLRFLGEEATTESELSSTET